MVRHFRDIIVLLSFISDYSSTHGRPDQVIQVVYELKLCKDTTLSHLNYVNVIRILLHMYKVQIYAGNNWCVVKAIVLYFPSACIC